MYVCFTLPEEQQELSELDRNYTGRRKNAKTYLQSIPISPKFHFTLVPGWPFPNIFFLSHQFKTAIEGGGKLNHTASTFPVRACWFHQIKIRQYVMGS